MDAVDVAPSSAFLLLRKSTLTPSRCAGVSALRRPAAAPVTRDGPPARPSPNTHVTSRHVTRRACDWHQCHRGVPVAAWGSGLQPARRRGGARHTSPAVLARGMLGMLRYDATTTLATLE